MASTSSSRKRKGSVIGHDGNGSVSCSELTLGTQSSGQSAKRSAMLRAAAVQRVLDRPSSMPGSSSSSTPPREPFVPNVAYMDLGDCSSFCEYCGASFWFEERVKASPIVAKRYTNIGNRFTNHGARK